MCFLWNKQHTKTWRCTKNADKHSARIHRAEGEKNKHRKQTALYLWLLPLGHLPESLHSWFKVIKFLHLIPGIFSTLCSRDWIQFSPFCWSALFHTPWLLWFIYKNSRWGVVVSVASKRIPELPSPHNTPELVESRFQAHWSGSSLIFTWLNLSKHK